MRRIPKDHTSDLMLNVPKLMASGAVHLMGNLAPSCQKEGEKKQREIMFLGGDCRICRWVRVSECVFILLNMGRYDDISPKMILVEIFL